jgi:imidazolonepropionase-like amidohydrolase
LIKNATLIDGDGSILSGRSLLLSEGTVKVIGDDITAPKNCKVIEVGGRYVSPGLVDMVKILV